MADIHLTVQISQEYFDRIQKLAPRKEWGENHKKKFYSEIFINGVESPYFLNLEKKYLETVKRLHDAILTQQGEGRKAKGLEDLARQMLEVEASVIRQREAVAKGANKGGAK